jgi:hypothetical protein
MNNEQGTTLATMLNNPGNEQPESNGTTNMKEQPGNRTTRATQRNRTGTTDNLANRTMEQ